MLRLPDNFETFEEVKKQSFLRIMKEKEEGKKLVGVFCTYTPLELIMAAGANFVSLCGGSEHTIAAAESVLPKNLCPLIKSSYGFAITDTCPYFYFSDAILAETTCDGKKKMYELLNRHKPVHVMHLPQGQKGPLAVESWKQAMVEAKEFLERELGVTITLNQIQDAIKKRNRIRKLLLKIYEIGKLNPSPVSGYEISSIIESSGFQFSDEDMEEELEKKYQELIARYQPQELGQSPRPRIMITGCPLTGVRDKIVKTVESMGADVVAFDNCSGPRTQERLVNEEMDPYQALAENYLQINCSVMTPNTDRQSDLERMIEEYRVDGVLEVVLCACHTFAIESNFTRETVTEKKGLPYLYVETDYSEGDLGQITTRLGAFLEMIKM